MSYPPSIEKALAYLQTVDIPKGYQEYPRFYQFFWKKGLSIIFIRFFHKEHFR